MNDSLDIILAFALDHGWTLEDVQRPPDCRDYLRLSRGGHTLSVSFASNGRIKNVFVDHTLSKVSWDRRMVFDHLRRI